MQKVITGKDYFAELDQFFIDEESKNLLIVCQPSIKYLKINDYLNSIEERLGIKTVRFMDFVSNPLYESVKKGVAVFNEFHADSILAIGGGSAMDVAKCIKLYAGMDPDINYLKQTPVPNNIRLIAMPTTAGTGSEATRYAVIYYEGKKQSVTDDSIIPSVVIMDPSCLKTLPLYQKKSTMLDALCHAVESYWSVNSTEESMCYSDEAIKLILANMDGYLNNTEEGNATMLKAAHIAGQAINITQTTAGHAMCYKLTSLYGIAHGQAAALCDIRLFPYMLNHLDDCIDQRGKAYLTGVFQKIAYAFGAKTSEEAVSKFANLYASLGLKNPQAKSSDYAVLTKSVNPVRLKNNPVGLSENAINELYNEILKETKEDEN